MNEVFEQGAQQKLVLYTEGNEIIAVRLPLRTGGEYVLRDGYLADLTAVVLENTIRFAWHSLEHRIILSDIHGRRDQVVLSDAMNASQYGGLRLVNREGKLWLFYTAKEPGESVWKGYLFQPEEEKAARELPGVYDQRPVLEIHRLGVWWILEMGLPGKFSYFIWEENGQGKPGGICFKTGFCTPGIEYDPYIIRWKKTSGSRNAGSGYNRRW